MTEDWNVMITSELSYLKMKKYEGMNINFSFFFIWFLYVLLVFVPFYDQIKPPMLVLYGPVGEA